MAEGLSEAISDGGHLGVLVLVVEAATMWKSAHSRLRFPAAWVGAFFAAVVSLHGQAFAFPAANEVTFAEWVAIDLLRQQAGDDDFPYSGVFDQPIHVGAGAIKIMREFRILWSDEGIGMPIIDGLSPFGTKDYVPTLVRLVGYRPKEELASRLVDAMLAWVVLLRAGKLQPGKYMLPWGAQSAKHITNMGGVPPADLEADGTFTFTSEQRTLLSHLWYAMPTWSQIDSRAIPSGSLATLTSDGNFPYGDVEAPWSGAAKALGWVVSKDANLRPLLSEADLAAFKKLHASIFAAALLLQAQGQLAPGDYQVPFLVNN